MLKRIKYDNQAWKNNNRESKDSLIDLIDFLLRRKYNTIKKFLKRQLEDLNLPPVFEVLQNGRAAKSHPLSFYSILFLPSLFLTSLLVIYTRRYFSLSLFFFPLPFPPRFPLSLQSFYDRHATRFTYA